MAGPGDAAGTGVTGDVFAILGRAVDASRPPYLVAEAGVNHNGDMRLALELIEAAAAAGADAVKFQTFRAASLATAGTARAAYQRASGGTSQLEMLRELELPADGWSRLARRAEELGIVFFSTPFDGPSVDMLAELGIPVFKVGSGDLTNALLLRAVAAHGLPVILSTGMGTLDDVDRAVQELRDGGAGSVALLHCASLYPAPEAEVNLRAIGTLRERFGEPIGFSDHTTGLTAPVVATALGARIIEKHLTLDQGLPGPDHAASLEPAAFGRLVEGVRTAWTTLGDGRKEPRPGEQEMMRAARRSLVTARALSAGHRLEMADLDAKRPGTGISPMDVEGVLGRRLAVDVEADHLLQPSDLDPTTAAT